MKSTNYEYISPLENQGQYVFHRKAFINTRTKIAPHWHDSIEVLAIEEGTVQVIIGTERYHLKKGDIICINSKNIHQILTTEKCYYHVLIISYTFFRQAGFPVPRTFETEIKDPEIYQEFQILSDEEKKKMVYYKTSQLSHVISIMLRLCRFHTLQETFKENMFQGANYQIKRCIDYIRSHYLEDISTHEISEYLHISANYLCSLFKQTMGTTIKKYINFLRCRDAQVMISTGKYTVMEVANQCGFYNMSYFSKIYLSIIGESPSVTAAHSKNLLEIPSH